ncbi:MAG: ABC transporter substrate-binding protein [Desulfovermiculus sp.]|nr:ABC transporter substrate-binding protein [Desulfovermiculus sp.]
MITIRSERRSWLGCLGLAGMSLVFCVVLGVNALGAVEDDSGPAGIVTAYYDQILEAFADEELSKEQLREKLQGMAREVFTFQIMAQMSLGRNWQDLDTDQQQEFVNLFTRLLENTYFQKIESHLSEIREYSADDLQVTDEIVFSSRKAEVQSQISYEGKKVPVHYRFVKMESGWKIYDVLVEEISLVQNYRSQFNDRLQKISVSEFLQDLQNKVHNLESREEKVSAANELQEQRLG